MSIKPRPILDDVEAYYSGKFAEHGATPRGVDWRDAASQRTRFEQLERALDGLEGASLLDYGCGYGALREYLHGERVHRYTGFDISEPMLEHARRTATDGAVFTSDRNALSAYDVVVASGIFNVRMDRPDTEWSTYVASTLAEMNALATRSFAFNMLTRYSDPDRMRPDLFYADPGEMFSMCVSRFSRWVALLHDYGLYEFTIVVRK